MDTAYAADQSWRNSNVQSRRPWTPPPLQRRRPALGGTSNRAEFVNSSSANTFAVPEDAAQRACAVACPDTANLLPRLALTVKDAARLMNVSERSVYMARRVLRARPDLADAIMRGELSLHAAAQIVGGAKAPDHFAALCRAWKGATEDEQARLLRGHGDAIEALPG